MTVLDWPLRAQQLRLTKYRAMVAERFLHGLLAVLGRAPEDR